LTRLERILDLRQQRRPANFGGFDLDQVARSSAQLTEETVALVLIDAQREGLVTELRLAVDARSAFIDKVQIQQVLVNLFRNAAEAMADAERKRLTVTTRRLGDRIQIEVADTGPGFTEQALSRVFEPFTTTKPTGMGVGLSLCRSIIETQGGDIAARNAHAGGAVITFTVPVAG
jgi:two-component system sensor kinase FixL